MRHNFKKIVSTLLVLAIWVVPSVEGFAADLRRAPEVAAPAPRAPVRSTEASFAELFPFGALASAGGWSTSATESSSYEARELASTDLQDFRGGAVSIYVGSGVLLVLVIVLLVLLI